MGGRSTLRPCLGCLEDQIREMQEQKSRMVQKHDYESRALKTLHGKMATDEAERRKKDAAQTWTQYVLPSALTGWQQSGMSNADILKRVQLARWEKEFREAKGALQREQCTVKDYQACHDLKEQIKARKLELGMPAARRRRCLA